MADPGPPPASNSSRWIFLVFFLGLGGLFGYYAWSQASGHLALASRGQRAEATVAGYEENRGRRSTTYYPVLRFATADGRRIEATSGASADPSVLRRGQRVAVLYDPADPTRARQAEAVEGGMGFTPWFLGILSLLMFALAAVFVLPPRAKAPG
jgi:hypothetical protein